MIISKTFLLITLMTFFLSCNLKQSKVERVPETHARLGKGAVWNHTTGQLMWVDITGKVLNIYNPRMGMNLELYTGQMIGAVVSTMSGKAIVALENGFYYLHPVTGTKTIIADLEVGFKEFRFNEGKCDPSGRFWAGTVSLDYSPGSGSLFRLDPDSSIHLMATNLSLPSGISWSNDHTRMYLIDAPSQKVMAYDFNNLTGEISQGKPVIEISEALGRPDGMTIDSDGNLWICLWGGAAVGCWNPDTGELLRKINVPALNVTSCAFGDSDLGTLYITTASMDANREERVKYPHAGSLFRVRPGVTGVEASFFSDMAISVENSDN